MFNEGLVGVVPALITPLRSDGRVDEFAVTKLVEHVIEGGVDGQLPLGSTGESASLDETARRTMLSSTVTAAAGRVPVICGVAQSHLSAARTEVAEAARLGATAGQSQNGCSASASSRVDHLQPASVTYALHQSQHQPWA
jgi:dihydrodipicolinate synthase/N-acetylneuraminate lyase